MINYTQIDRKLDFAGLSALSGNRFTKLKRTAQVLMKASAEQAEYVIRKICSVNPYAAAECVADTKNPAVFRKMILEATASSDIPAVYKLVVYYRFKALPKAYGLLQEEMDLEGIDADRLFWSWTDFCHFVSDVIHSMDQLDQPGGRLPEQPGGRLPDQPDAGLQDQPCVWLQELICEKTISTAALFQNRTETRDFLNLLLEKGYSKGVLHIYEAIGLDSYYSLTNQKYEDICSVFRSGKYSLKEQMKYCWVDSVHRGINLFDSFYCVNPDIWEDAIGVFAALLYEYQVTDDTDPQFRDRCSRASACDSVVRRAGGNKVWRKLIAENLIRCTRICMQDSRDIKTFLHIFEKVNIFSFKTSMALGVDVFQFENLQIDDSHAKALFEDCAHRLQTMDVMDLYLNSFLKFIISFDSAMRIVYEAVPPEVFERYLRVLPFPAKISHKDSSQVIIRLRNLSSRAYTPPRDRVLCEEMKKDDKIFVGLRFSAEEGLFVSCVGYKEEEIRNTPDYAEAAKECIQIIEKMADGSCTRDALDRLRTCSEIPMYYVKESLDAFLAAVRRIPDHGAFMRVIIHLSWNRKYWYSQGREYESEDVKFFSRYKRTAQEILKELLDQGLSRENLVQIYMNSFFKLTCAPDELRMFTGDELAELFRNYLFVGALSPQQTWRCVSAKNFVSTPFEEVPPESVFAPLDRRMFRLTRCQGETRLAFCGEETERCIIPRRINRLKRAYEAISQSTSVRGYEYEYIRMISPDFYRDDEEVCRFISDCTIKAANLRHKTFSGLQTMIRNLGASNIYGAGFHPLTQHKQISHFSRSTGGRYDYASRLCHSYIRCCSRLSEAVWLFINTYVKCAVSFSDYLEWCLNSDLEKDSFRETLWIVVNLRKSDSQFHINCIDVSIKGIEIDTAEFPEEVPEDDCYAEVEVAYDGALSCRIRSLTRVQ